MKTLLAFVLVATTTLAQAATIKHNTCTMQINEWSSRDIDLEKLSNNLEAKGYFITNGTSAFNLYADWKSDERQGWSIAHDRDNLIASAFFNTVQFIGDLGESNAVRIRMGGYKELELTKGFGHTKDSETLSVINRLIGDLVKQLPNCKLN